MSDVLSLYPWATIELEISVRPSLCLSIKNRFWKTMVMQEMTYLYIYMKRFRCSIPFAFSFFFNSSMFDHIIWVWFQRALLLLDEIVAVFFIVFVIKSYLTNTCGGKIMLAWNKLSIPLLDAIVANSNIYITPLFFIW